jgi:hypothetical protein
MQIKLSNYTLFGTHQIPQNLHFASPFAKKKKNEKKKIKARNINPLSWERQLHLTYATSLSKPRRLPSGRVKFHESLPETRAEGEGSRGVKCPPPPSLPKNFLNSLNFVFQMS